MDHLPRLHQIILGTLFWILISFFLVVPLSVFLIIKCVVIIIAATVRSDLYWISAGDSIFAVGSSWKKTKNNLGFLLRVEGTLDLSAVQKKFSSVLLEPKVGKKPKYEKLHSCLVTWCGFVFRRSIPIDLERLDELIYVKKLGYQESLEELMDKWLIQGYKENSPAWEMIIIPNIHNNSSKGISGVDCSEEFGLAFKIHHAFADGYSLLHILDAITEGKSPYLVKDHKESFCEKIADILVLPLNISTIFGEGFPTTNLLRVSKPQSVWMHSFSSIDLRILKSLRQQHNVHFTSILLTLVTGAIRHYLLENVKENLLPSYLPIVNPLPWPNHSRKYLTNHWSLGVIKTSIKWDDPLKRLLEVEQYFINFHNLGLHKCAKQLIFPFLWLAPESVFQNLLKFDPGYSVSLTSLVGADKYSFLGKTVSRVHPLLNLSDTNPFGTLFWFTITHSNKIDICLAGVEDLFRNRDCLDRIQNVYLQNELEKLCHQSGIPYLH